MQINSTPEQVVDLLGYPQLKLESDNLWIYARTRARSTDGLGGYSHDYRAILIEFSEKRVVSKDIFYKESELHWACWSDRYNLCLWPKWESTAKGKDKPKLLSRTHSSVTSSREDDSNAKNFKPTDGDCAIYVYLGAYFSTDLLPPVISVGNARDEPVPYGGYFHLASPPQQLRLEAGRNSVEIDCQEDSLYFYKLQKFFTTDHSNIHIKSVGSEEGKKAVLKLKRLVSW